MKYWLLILLKKGLILKFYHIIPFKYLNKCLLTKSKKYFSIIVIHNSFENKLKINHFINILFFEWLYIILFSFSKQNSKEIFYLFILLSSMFMKLIFFCTENIIYSEVSVTQSMKLHLRTITISDVLYYIWQFKYQIIFNSILHKCQCTDELKML